jgi:hypothetical protein
LKRVTGYAIYDTAEFRVEAQREADREEMESILSMHLLRYYVAATDHSDYILFIRFAIVNHTSISALVLIS